MACHVFGTPVTDATLKGMTEYHDKAINAIDRARVALQMKNAEGKDIEARNFVDKIQADVAKKGVRCLIYNATGGPLKLVAVFEYAGCVSESPYPTVLQNGQWASFVHEKENNSTRSIAALIFEATQDNPPRQWVLGWYQTNNVISKCYAEIRQRGHYSMNSNDTVRRALRTLIEGSKFIHEAQNTGDAIFSTIGNTPLPIYEAIMTRNVAL